MSLARIAILIDGGFFNKRLPALLEEEDRVSPEKTVEAIRQLCFNHVMRLTGAKKEVWKRHVYRIFYYDATPYEGKAHHPIENTNIDFAKSDLARERHELFERLRKERKVALRLGKVNKEHDWALSPKLTKRLLKTKSWLASLPELTGASEPLVLSADQLAELKKLQELWGALNGGAVQLGLKQKGVDMRIGIDITSMTLKKQVDIIVLVAGDSDFVPAAKLARREGVEFILDPLWQSVNSDLFEHIDGLQSGLKKPNGTGDAAEH